MSDTLCALRARAQHLAATLCAVALRARVAALEATLACTDAAIARRWAVPTVSAAAPKPLQPSYVGRFFDPESGKAITLRDVLALPKALARDILLRALASLEDGDGPGASECLGDIIIEAGETTATLRRDRADDGRENDYARHRDHFARLAATAMRGYLAADKRAREAGK